MRAADAGAAICTATEGVEMAVEQIGRADMDFLSGFMDGATEGILMRYNLQAMEHTALLGQRGAKRCSYSFEPQHTGIRMEVGLGSSVPACMCPLSFLAALRAPRVPMARACACLGWI